MADDPQARQALARGPAVGLPGGAASTSPLPPAVRAEVIELLARALLADVRKHADVPEDHALGDATGAPRRGSDRG